MNTIWWLPTVVLAVGSGLLMWRMRALERQVEAASRALVRVHTTADAVQALDQAAQRTRAERTRVAGILPSAAKR